MAKSLELKVAEALQNDVGRGLVRIDSKARKDLDVSTGDIVELKGKRSTAALVWQAHPQDEGLNIIRMDGYLRQNTGVGLGDKLVVKKAELKEAKKVVLAPTQPMKYSPGFDQFVKKKMIGRALNRGDTIFIGVFGTSFPLIAAVVQPTGIVMVNENTELVLKEAPEKEVPQISTITYDDIGGLKEEVKKIQEMVELPIRHPELFERLGIEAPKGVLIYGPPGCVTGDTLIALEDGRLIRIEELAGNFNPGIYIADLPIYPPASAKALHIYDVPETIEILTETGKRLAMTPNHPLMTPNGWKEAEKLNVGEKVKVFKWLPSPTQYVSDAFIPRAWHTSVKADFPKIFDEDLGELLGIFTAEGTANELRISFAINSNEGELKERILCLMKRFNVEVRLAKVYGKNCIKLFFNSRLLKDYFSRFWSKSNKHVPAQVLLSPNSVVAAFLRGLFEGDGTAHSRIMSYGVEFGVSLKSKSRKLLEECQVLLLRFKIASRIYRGVYRNKKGSEFESYELRVRGKENLHNFAAHIGFISSPKRKRLEFVLKNYKRDLSYLRSEYEKIVSARKVEGWQRVYDFEVPSTHAFFSNGVLSHNTGKTLLAKAVASESDANFVHIGGPELVSKFVGESEEKLRQIFKDAQENAPSIIFMDEIDAIAPKREEATGEVERRMVSQLLTLMDGLKARGTVIVIGATNRQNSLDPALRRPGRFDREVELGVPDRQGRKEILQIHARNMPLDEGHLFSAELKFDKITAGFDEKKLQLKDYDELEKFLKSNENSVELYSKDGTKKYRIKKEMDKAEVYEGGVDIDELAAITHGYTGADISALTREAAMKVLRRILPNIDLEQEFIPAEILDNLKVTREDFFNALREIRPSALREVFIERPNVRWADIGGLENVKKELKEAVELPLKNPEVFGRMGIRPVKGILLVGLPGTGKTMFAKAVATETEANFISIKGPEVLSKWVGDSEKAVRELFRKARMATPCVIFIDEIDSIAPHRGAGDEGNRVTERVVDTLLTEMDGLTGLKNVVVIAATNRPELLDMALLRGGRFDRIIEIPPPDEKTRLEIFRIHSRSMPTAKGVDLEDMAKKTEGYTGADIENICREAGMSAIRRGVDTKEVTKGDFEDALSTVKPSITKAYVDKIKKFAKGEINSMYR